MDPLERAKIAQQVTALNDRMRKLKLIKQAISHNGHLVDKERLKRINAVRGYYNNKLAPLMNKLRKVGKITNSNKLRRYTEKTKAIWDKIEREDKSLPEFLIGNKVVREIPMELLHLDFKKHRRLIVFHTKGLKCSNPKCNKVGTRLIITIDGHGNKHVDIYTNDYILMNVDHIHPKSKGGSEELSNKQPMCEPCNSNKSDREDYV